MSNIKNNNMLIRNMYVVPNLHVYKNMFNKHKTNSIQETLIKN